MAFPKFVEDFDNLEQKDYTVKWRLREGETILTAQVEPVDAVGLNVIGDSPLVFGPISFAVDAGTVFGVTQWILPMVDPLQASFMAYLRFTITTDWAQPIPRKLTRRMRLLVKPL